MSHQPLLDHEHVWNTRIGKAFLCERTVMRGKDLHHELGDWDWFKLYLYGITGRELADNQIRMLSYFWVATSYADPSIWPNHVAALGGSVRSTASLSCMAGLAISEASIYGRRPEKRALDFFYRTAAALDKGDTLAAVVEREIRERKTIYGYGRPLAKMDERIPHTLQKAKQLGLAEGRYLRLALDVYRYLKAEKGLSMNISAVNTAIVADIGLSPEEYQLFLTPCFITGIAPCYIDARDKPEGAFFPMRCESLSGETRPKRVWD
ncbi:hypothetical protein EV700_2288 [Fluviicoccus keumensis]|uniref:Uncharacterized protein n=1 Tax=Fluviicoccus keumensis TaxID=1435465 RepID=A0A4Q7YLC2_9GAMM|nr:citrate/2-methylcitrate synthase [Fluviicoccus keumensis]RZU38357.1 hypothetical protein EV700_2288 [Fluviicoccus keumensis]